jgi:membrane-associated PAP2 superfamily phosphatase
MTSLFVLLLIKHNGISCIRIENKAVQQVAVQFYVYLPFVLMLGVVGRDFEGYRVLYSKDLVADN